MPTWYYFARPSNLAFHDFTKKHKPEKYLRSLLGLGLKFIPTPSLTNSWSRLRKSSYDRLFRSVHLRFHFAGRQLSKMRTSYDPKLYVRSKWTPPHWTIPPVALEERLLCFSTALNKLFKTRKGKTNLLPHQQQALRMLQQQQTFLIVPCDKNLGPAIIERHDYLKIAMRDHLSDTTTYKTLTTSEIDRYSLEIKKHILGWHKTYNKKTDQNRTCLYLRRTEIKSVTICTLLPHPGSPQTQIGTNGGSSKKPTNRLLPWQSTSWPWCLGRPQATRSRPKNSILLLKHPGTQKQLLELHLPANTCLFTADAMSMYTNIPTHMALNLIGKYLTQYQLKNNKEFPQDTVRAGLRLIMTMNIFTFGDITLKQLNGTAMGTPPAPPYATIYYRIHEEKFLPHHSRQVIYQRRFINAILAYGARIKSHNLMHENGTNSNKK